MTIGPRKFMHGMAIGAIAAGVLFMPGSVRAHGETLIQIAAVTREIAASTNNVAQLYLQRAELYREHKDWNSAAADYERAAKLDPHLPADRCRAGMLYDSGNLEAAGVLFDAVIERNPQDGEAFVGRARVAVKDGKSAKAVADFRRGLELLAEPQSEHFRELAAALKAENKTAEALHVLDAGVRKLGPIVPLQECAVELDVQLGNHSSALSRLDTILQHASRKEQWFQKKGEILLLANRPEEARKAFKSALKALDLLPKRLQEGPDMLELQSRVKAALRTIDDSRREALSLN